MYYACSSKAQKFCKHYIGFNKLPNLLNSVNLKVNRYFLTWKAIVETIAVLKAL